MADTLRGLTVDLKGALDFASLERMPASFVTEHLGRRHADMLWKIRTVNEEWLYLLVLIEFQSTIDQRMALRMMNYAGGIWMGLGRDDLGPGGEYPSVLPVVVYNGERSWNAATDIRDLLASVPEQLLGTQPQHPYLLIELQTLDPSTLPYGSVLELKIRSEEEARMTTLIERAREWGEELNQHWLEKGIEEGVARGRLEGERALVYRLVARRFGPGATEQLVPVLDGITDPELIAGVADAVVECRTAAEFIGRVNAVVDR